MRKISIPGPGGYQRLKIETHPDPEPGKGEVLVAKGTADPGSTVNRGGQVIGGHQKLGRTLRTLKHGRIPVAHEAHLVVALCPKGSPREENPHEKEKRSSQKCSSHRRLTENPDNPDYVRVVQY